MAVKSVLEVIKKFGLSFRRNWGLKLVSLLFAVILWNYVITAPEVNPTRPASFNGIKIVFDQSSITQLENSGFTVKGALPEQTVNVTIDIPRNQYNNLNRDSISATVSLSGITSVGEKKLKVNVYTPRGIVKIQSVSTLAVEIERLEKHSVPVKFLSEGELPEGYWMEEPSIKPEVVEISGASSLVGRVDLAVVVIDLSDRRESYSGAPKFLLLDGEGNTVPSGGITIKPSNAILNLDIYPTKIVDVTATITGNVAQGYQSTDVAVEPRQVTIAGPQPVLDTITSVATAPVDISGLTQDHSNLYALALPNKDLIAVGGSSVKVTVKVEQKMVERPLEDLPVQVLNLGPGLKVDGKQILADITVTCPELMASKIKSSMIRLTVDAAGLDARTHTLNIQAEYDAEETGIAGLVINPPSILVTITAAPE